jgi:hypothetical protein
MNLSPLFSKLALDPMDADHFALSLTERISSCSSSACGIIDKALALSEKLSKCLLL